MQKKKAKPTIVRTAGSTPPMCNGMAFPLAFGQLNFSL